MPTHEPKTLTPEETEFIFEWMREWHRGLMFEGPAKKALKELGISVGALSDFVKFTGLNAMEQLEVAESPISEVPCPWKSREEFRRRKAELTSENIADDSRENGE